MPRKHSSDVESRQPHKHSDTAASSAKAAAELESLVGQYPEEREDLLVEAAGEWSAAGEHDRALALYERLLDEGCESPHLIKAYRVGALWEAGREEEARTAAEELRAEHPRDGGAWNFVGEIFETAGEPRKAAEWYTAGIAHALGTAAPLTVEDVRAGHFDAETLVIGRHRVRRLMGEPHDDWDDLADAVHEARPALLRGVASLDELHDPKRQGALESDDPDVLAAELERLSAQIGRGTAAPQAPTATCTVFWPEEELAELLRRHPSFEDDHGSDHAAHLRRVEETLRGLSDEGAPRLTVAAGTVEDFTRYADAEGRPPESTGLRAAYAADLAARGKDIAWPPPRNGPCWCGSGRKYKKCCGNPALG